MSALKNFIEQHDYPCWCGESRARIFCRQRLGRPFAVQQCPGCGTHRILPKAIATAKAAQELYNDAEHTRAGFSPAIAAENVRRILRRIERVGISFEKESTVVDVGCSEGLLLETIRKRHGCRVVGVDVDERALARARRDFPQVTFLAGLAQDLQGQLPLADVVIASAIIEHVLNPVEFVEQLQRLLKPGGETIFAHAQRREFPLPARAELVARVAGHRRTRFPVYSFEPAIGRGKIRSARSSGGDGL